MVEQWKAQGILLAVLLLVGLTTGLPQQRRMRVKTIENITAAVTTPQPTIITTAVNTNEPSAGIQRLRRPTARKLVGDRAKNDEKRGSLTVEIEINGTDPKVHNAISTTDLVRENMSMGSIELTHLETTTATVYHPEGRGNRAQKLRKPIRGDNHIHVESNYTVTSLPMTHNSENARWKSSRIKENVRRKNILSRTSAQQPEIKGAESQSKGLLPKSRQGIQHFQESQMSRPFSRPQKNSTSVYNFETGKAQGSKSDDQSPSTSNDVPNEQRSATDFYKIKNENEEEKKPKKRFSSRYSGQRHYNRGTTTEKPADVEDETATIAQLLEEQPTTERSPEYMSEETAVSALQTPIQQEYESVEAISNASNEDKSADLKDTAPEEEDKGNLAINEEKTSKGSGAEHHSEFQAAKGEKHKKGYKGGHEYGKGSKGFHDKERHSGKYRDEKGSKKVHKEGGGHFEAGQHVEKGQKSADHAEKEEYKKGHSTRGGHVVHKLDEYEKKLEFFDESYDSGDGEKFGSHFESYGSKKGGHKKGGHKKSKSAGRHKSTKGRYLKGKHDYEDKGHDKKAGKEGHFGHDEKYGQKGGKKSEHKYNYTINKGAAGKSQAVKEQPQEIVKHEDELEEKESADKIDDRKDEITDGQRRKTEEVAEDEERPELKSVNTEKNFKYMNENGPTSHFTQKVKEEGAVEDETPIEDEENVDIKAKNAKFMNEDGPTPHFTQKVEEKGADEDETPVEDEENVDNKAKNAKFMNEDGPTSYFTHRGQEKIQEVDEVAEEVYEPEIEIPHRLNKYLPDDLPTGKGYFMTEKEAKEDKEGEEALHVFGHEDSGHRPERSSYEVNEKQEQDKSESRTVISVDVPAVRIVARSILPPKYSTFT